MTLKDVIPEEEYPYISDYELHCKVTSEFYYAQSDEERQTVSRCYLRKCLGCVRHAWCFVFLGKIEPSLGYDYEQK